MTGPDPAPDPASADLAAAAVLAFGCDAALGDVVAAKARAREWPARATILATGDAVDAVFLMAGGHARLLAFSAEGRLVVVEDFARGDLFGEGCLFDRPVMREDVAAVDAVRAGAIAAPAFLGLMTGYSAIALAVSRLLVARLGTATRRLVEGATLSATGRIHAELLRQARAGEDMTIRPAPVLATLALSVQSTRESVSRAINALQKRGIIARDAEALRVVAPHRLEELVY